MVGLTTLPCTMSKISLFNAYNRLLMEVHSDGKIEFPKKSKAAIAFKKSLSSLGIAIPHLKRHFFGGKRFIKLEDKEFIRAFRDVFIPDVVEDRSSPYHPHYEIRIEE